MKLLQPIVTVMVALLLPVVSRIMSSKNASCGDVPFIGAGAESLFKDQNSTPVAGMVPERRTAQHIGLTA